MGVGSCVNTVMKQKILCTLVGAEKVHELTMTYNILSKTAASETNWFAHFGENGRKQTYCEILSLYNRRPKGRGRLYEGNEQFWIQTTQCCGRIPAFHSSAT
jgi:hypothetical protein